MTRPSSAEQGSVLMWILVAVVLLAGLTAAMNQGSRTSTGMVTGQEARLYASEIIQYGNTVKQAVQRMNMNGISEGDFSFENTVFKFAGGAPRHPSTSYPNCTEDKCKVFHPLGGSIQANHTPNGSTVVTNEVDAPFAGAWSPWTASIDGVGTDQSDLIFMVGFLKKEVCTAINDVLGVSNPAGEPPSFSYNTTVAQYHLASPYQAAASGWSDGIVTGRESFCFRAESSGNAYIYMVTLIAR